MRPFFITALPRSGTTFLANFMTHSGVHCWHEALCGAKDMDEYVARMSLRDYLLVGDSDSGLPMIHGLVRQTFPDALWIGIDRPADQVKHSLYACGGWPGNECFDTMVHTHQQVLTQCSLVVPFDTLFLTETLRNIWHTATQGLRFDPRRAQMLADMRVQPNLDRYLPRYRQALAAPMPVGIKVY